MSLVCGDGLRDPILEECDDGIDSAPLIDSCDDQCRVQDVPLLERSAPDAGPPLSGRTLGDGRHPVAAGDQGFAVAFIEPDATPTAVSLTTFTETGVPNSDQVTFSVGSSAVLFANPVLAALPGGKYAAAWTDFNGDGDELGVALRLVDPATPPSGPPAHANTSTDFGQSDPDILYVPPDVVVAWVDHADAFNGPDVKYRTFSESLSPTSGEVTLAGTAASEANVALAPFSGSWVAAWRSTASGSEFVEVVAGGVSWTVGTSGMSPFLPPPADEKPALVELDATHLLVVFTEATDPAMTGVANTPRLRVAILDTSAPGPVVGMAVNQMLPGFGDPEIAQSHANAIRVEDKIFLTWRTSRVLGDPNAEELWLAEVEWDGATLTINEEFPLPRWPDHQLGDQRRPALAAVPSSGALPGGAIASAWDDLGRTFGPISGTPDVVVELIPVPIVRMSGGGTSPLCGANEILMSCSDGLGCAVPCNGSAGDIIGGTADPSSCELVVFPGQTDEDICFINAESGFCDPGWVLCSLSCVVPCDGTMQCPGPPVGLLDDESEEVCGTAAGGDQ